MQVLLVDDSRSSLARLGELLGQIEDVSTTAFLDAESALAQAEKERFDLAIVDHIMPKMDGIAFIAGLSRTRFHKQTPKIMLTGTDESSVRMSALAAGATDFLNKSMRSDELLMRLRNAAELSRALRKLIDSVESQARELDLAAKQLLLREEEMVFRLSRALEYRDSETGDHAYRVAVYSRMIAERLGLPEHDCRALFLASPLHDIGKVAVPDAILLKRARLDDCERSIVQTHAEVGGRILSGSRVELITLAATIAAAHHERWDGEGYPLGLKGDAIPIVARIVAVADVFDALTSERPYKEPMPLGKALAIMQAESGRHFDPACVEAFLTAFGELAGSPPALSRLRCELDRRYAGAVWKSLDVRNIAPSAA
jgi:putative two-component system response regulator